MSFAVHFLQPATAAGSQPFGDPEAAVDDEQPSALSSDEIATWDALHPVLIPLLPAGSHELTATEFSRQLVHEASGLLVSWLHDDYQLELPYWSQNATPELFDALRRITAAVEAQTGLVGVDDVTERRFLDDPDESLATFGAVAGGFEEAMESQSVLGWLRDKLHRN